MSGVTRTAMEGKVLSVFQERRCELTECDVKESFPEELEKRWIRSVLTKLYMKNDIVRVKRYNRHKHCAEWIYSLPKNI